MPSPGRPSPSPLGSPVLADPIWYFSNWSGYDILSDDVELTEELALAQLRAIVRLKQSGVRLDYYMMDAGWWAPDTGYRTWHPEHWPDGPERWIDGCLENGIKPGLWFATNTWLNLDVAPAWRDSVGVDDEGRPRSMSFTEGGFLADFMDVLQLWYDRGVRMFKLDFADFDAVAGSTDPAVPDPAVREGNKTALRQAMIDFRRKNPESVFLAYNGFMEVPAHDPELSVGEIMELLAASSVDLRWLDVFASLYTADAHPPEIVLGNLWRSMDFFSDQWARRYEHKFVPLERIDNAGFMCGPTNTSVSRGLHAWKGMLLLAAARGGWVTTIYGGLDLIDDEGARWFARVQDLYLGLHATGRTKTFGGDIGELQPYGFGSVDATGSVYTVVNPSDEVVSVTLPRLSRVQPELAGGSLLFRDAGFVPVVGDASVTLGPGQLAAVGFGRYADSRFDLGIQEDVVIPSAVRPLEAAFVAGDDGAIRAVVDVPAGDGVRVILRQFDEHGAPLSVRSADGMRRHHLGDLLDIELRQGDRTIPLRSDHRRFIWNAPPWAAAEARAEDLEPGVPVVVTCSSTSAESFVLGAELAALGT